MKIVLCRRTRSGSSKGPAVTRDPRSAQLAPNLRTASSPIVVQPCASRRLADADHLRVELVANPFGELSLSASDLEHPSRPCLHNSFEGELARVVAFGVDVGRLACSEIVLALVLRPDERSLVDGMRQPR